MSPDRVRFNPFDDSGGASQWRGRHDQTHDRASPARRAKPYTRNARTHSPKQISEIAASIKAFGFNNPVLIDKNGGIVAGHGRVEAAKQLGLLTVPTIRLEHLSDAQKRAYILADNKLAEKAGWDREILAIELQNLMEINLDFDIAVTGFEFPEIDVLIEELETKPAKADPADEVPVVDGPVVTRPGDLWQIGPRSPRARGSPHEPSPR